MDREETARPHRRTALVAKENSRYNIDIAALSETGLAFACQRQAAKFDDNDFHSFRIIACLARDTHARTHAHSHTHAHTHTHTHTHTLSHTHTTTHTHTHTHTHTRTHALGYMLKFAMWFTTLTVRGAQEFPMQTYREQPLSLCKSECFSLRRSCSLQWQ